jgi:hypothetical protein
MLPETRQSHVEDRRTGNAEAVPEQAAGMRLVFVNGRTPRGNAHCALCREEIGDGYMRDIATGLIYCNRHCGTGHSGMAGLASRVVS